MKSVIIRTKTVSKSESCCICLFIFFNRIKVNNGALSNLKPDLSSVSFPLTALQIVDLRRAFYSPLKCPGTTEENGVSLSGCELLD